MDRRVREICKLREAHPHEKRSLADIASRVNLSPSRASHLCRKETGTSPARYLKTLRMQKAGALLTSTFLSVKEIGARVGFVDDSHFVRSFKQVHGVTPSQYRLSKLARTTRTANK